MIELLLRDWCTALLHYQIHGTGDTRLDGGILCPACMRVHGRSGDAVFPLVTMWARSGEEQWLTAAEELFAWSENMVRPDESYNNDTNSSWNGITVFSSIGLGETLLHYGGRLPQADRAAWTARFETSSRYLLQNIEAIGGNINYPVTCAYAMALASKLLPGGAAYAAKAKQLASYACEHFTGDGLLYGEGHPREAVSPKGCRPVDIGYNVEESLPALAQYAALTGDEDTMQRLLPVARSHLYFMLPDGGWDNSFGSRSYKWSYWGSRTSDGCAAGFSVLAKYDPMFAEAARRNLALLRRCTKDGILYGGPMFTTAGEPACIHHTICHAKAVAALVADGVEFPDTGTALPADTSSGIHVWPTIHTRQLIRGGWHATVTDYDYQYLTGGHPTGGALSLLWHRAWGPVLAGSMDPYRQNEPNNMQMPRYQFDICTTPRLEVHNGSATFSSSNDMSAWVQSGESGSDLWAEACGQLRNGEQVLTGGFRLRYTVTERSFVLEAASEAENAKLHLPVISAEWEAVDGLGTETIHIRRSGRTLTVQANQPLDIPPMYRTADAGLRRLFNPVGGFQFVPLTAEARKPLRLHISVAQEESQC